MRTRLLLLSLSSIAIGASSAQTLDARFFNDKILPVLSKNCFACHSSALSSPKSGFAMDTKAGLARGGVLGGDLIPGNPDKSRLMKAIGYGDTELQMPPSG